MNNIVKLCLTIALSCATCVGAKSTEDKVKTAIDEAADSLKRGVDNIENSLEAVQDYLDHYHWKGILQDEVVVEPITLKHLQLNGHSKAVAVYPGERIEGSVVGVFNCDKCRLLTYYRVVLGLPDIGPQTTICHSLGGFANESLEKFVLIAPKEPGIYQLRFHLVEAFTESGALSAWEDPGPTGTIGLIIVKY